MPKRKTPERACDDRHQKQDGGDQSVVASQRSRAASGGGCPESNVIHPIFAKIKDPEHKNCTPKSKIEI
jgi:hypothetical protein